MAGDWIKLRTDLQTDPAVIRLVSVLKLDTFGVIGRLAAVWVWADTHADRHGRVTLVSRSCLDSLTSCEGFGAALESVGWLKSEAEEGAGITFPRFERHMGKGAKQRAQAANRKRKQRSGGGEKASRSGHVDVTKVSRTKRDKSVTREEKRREEIEEGKPLPGNPGEKAPRPRNLLFDAVAEVSGLDPSTAGGRIGTAAAALAKADPPYTPAEVREFGQRFWQLCSWAADNKRTRPTPHEIAGHIGLIRAGPGDVRAAPTPGNARDAYVTGLVRDALSD